MSWPALRRLSELGKQVDGVEKSVRTASAIILARNFNVGKPIPARRIQVWMDRAAGSGEAPTYFASGSIRVENRSYLPPVTVRSP